MTRAEQEEAVEQHIGFVIWLVRKRCRTWDEDEQEEALSDALLGLWQAVMSYDGELSNLTTWIGNKVAWVIADEYRKRHHCRRQSHATIRTVSFAEEDRTHGQGALIDSRSTQPFAHIDDKDECESYLSVCNEKKRRHFRRYYWQYMTQEQLAAADQISWSAVYMMMAKGMARMRAEKDKRAARCAKASHPSRSG